MNSIAGCQQAKTSVRFLTAAEAVLTVLRGARVMVGGFGLTGIPEELLAALLDQTDSCDLTVISNNITQGSNLDKLFRMGRIRKAIGTYFTTNRDLVQAYRQGRIEIDLLPQGTFTEAIRLGGGGIAAFYTPTAAGTQLAEGKETRQFNGCDHVLEETLTADVALVRAHKADRAGNLIYRKSARNFNPLMASAAKVTIAEVEEIVETGTLDPESIATPFIFVDMIVKRNQHNR